jgi:hypothetical protein
VEGLADIFAQDTIAMTPSLNLTLGLIRLGRIHRNGGDPTSGRLRHIDMRIPS